MDRLVRCATSLSALSLLLAATGCNSPYHTDRGALVGGLTGAGLGAVAGNALGNTAAGAALGAGVGALSGAAIGNSLDDIEARNRAEIEARIGRPMPGAVTVNDVVAMTRAGVDEEVISSHVRNHGMVAPLAAPDLIMLKQQGVSPRVVQAMQAPPPSAAMPVAYAAPGPVVVQEYAPPPYWGPYYYARPRYRCAPPPGVHWGVTVGR